MVTKTIFTLLFFFSICYSQFIYSRVGNCDILLAGAIANDTLDDWQPIQHCINNGSCGEVIIGSAITDTFLLSRPLELKSNFTLTINGVLKIMDADSGLLAADISIGDCTFVADDASAFFVGDWVGVIDDSTIYSHDSWYGWSGEIIEINGDTIKLDGPSFDSTKVSNNGRFANTISAIICDTKSDVVINGSGKILGNRDNQMRIHPVHNLGFDEYQKEACGIVIWKSTNVTISDLMVRDFFLHNIAITGDATNDNNNITLTNLNCRNGRDKNILVRYSTNVTATNIIADSATYEDGLIFYGGNSIIVVDSIFVSNCYRFGFSWNGLSDSLIATNIYSLGGCGYGLAITAKNSNFTNVILKDPMLVQGTYDGEDAFLTNVVFDSVVGDVYSDFDIFRSLGNFHNLEFDSLMYDSCDGNAIHILDIGGGIPILPPEEYDFHKGGIYNHAGPEWEVVAGTDIDTSNFYMYRPRYTAGFNPIDTYGLFAFDAKSNVTTVNDSVSLWEDLVHSYDAFQDTLPRRPEDRDSSIYFSDNDALYVDNVTADTFDLGTSDFTISGKFNVVTADTPFQHIFSKYYNGSNSYYLRVYGNDIYFAASSGGVTATNFYSNPAKHLIHDSTDYTFTYSADRNGISRLYLNGYPQYNTTIVMNANDINIPSTDFTIGALAIKTYPLIGDLYWVQIDTVLRDKQWAYDFWYRMGFWPPTSITADTNGVDSIDVIVSGYDDNDTDSTFAFATSASCVPSKDSVGIDSISCADSLESWTFAHGSTYGGTTIYIYLGVQDLSNNMVWDSLEYDLPLIIPEPPAYDSTRPDIVGDFIASAAVPHNISMAEGVSIVSNADDFDYFNVWFKVHQIDNYVLIDTLQVFNSIENIRLPNTIFMVDSGFIVITAVDTNANETLFANALKDTIGFVPAQLYITFLTGNRGQPQYYWLHRNEADSTVSDSILIPQSHVDTSLVDTCKVPLIPQDTLVTAYYALRTLTNDTLGVMSAWLKWPSSAEDDETPPLIAGEVSTEFDSTSHIKVITTSATSSSPDFALFNVYFKARAIDSYVLQETDADINVGDRYAIDDTLGHNDSGFVMIKAVDDSANISTTAIYDTFITQPYFVLFKTGGGRRVDIDNVWMYLSKDSSAIADSFRLAMWEIDTVSYKADSLDVPVSPPINGYGRYYSGRSDSSGTLKLRSDWKWYPQPALPDSFSADSVAYDTVKIVTHTYISEATLRGTYNVRYKAVSHPTSITDGTSLYSGTDTSAIGDDKFVIAGVGGTTQYFSLFTTKNGNTNTSSLLDTVTFPSAPAGGCPGDAGLFAWNGDYAEADSLKGCGGPGTFTKLGVTSGTVENSETYGYGTNSNGFRVTADNEYLNFTCDSGDSLIDDATGTIWMHVLVVKDAAMTHCSIFEASPNSTNYITIQIRNDRGIAGYFRDNVNQQAVITNQIAGADTITWDEGTNDQWHWIGYSWDTANNVHGVTIDNDSWGTNSETIDPLATQPINVCIGEKDRGSTQSDEIRVDDVYIYNTYQAAMPTP